ncbi:MAG: DUF5035 family protein [Bacteroides sp.]
MKKIVSLLFSLLLLAACSTNGLSPVITVTSLYVNDDTIDYAQTLGSMPSLVVGDEVNVTLDLNGNGAELKTFQVNRTAEIKLDSLGYEKREVTSEIDFTDVEGGRLRFVDGVNDTHLLVKAKVVSTTEKETKLSFYLSSKAETNAAQYDLVLKTGV